MRCIQLRDLEGFGCECKGRSRRRRSQRVARVWANPKNPPAPPRAEENEVGGMGERETKVGLKMV